jgi:hypothetical protein
VRFAELPRRPGSVVRHVAERCWRSVTGSGSRSPFCSDPGGRLYYDGLAVRAQDRPIVLRLCDHPFTGGFSAEDLVGELCRNGLYVFATTGRFLLGVARKPMKD